MAGRCLMHLFTISLEPSPFLLFHPFFFLFENEPERNNKREKKTLTRRVSNLALYEAVVMYRRSLAKLGLFSVFMEELRKVPSYLSYKMQSGAKAYVDSASQTLEFLKGEDPSESPEMREKRRKHKEMYQAILNAQAAKDAAERAEAQQERSQLSWKQRVALRMQEAKEALQQMTSTKAGVMAVLQHCTASHAAEVALEQGIDVKNVQMVLEKAAATSAVGHEDVVVGYIDAPSASREEVMAFAEKLHKACPVANSMHIEWRQGRPDAYSRDGERARRADNLQGEMERAARQVEWEESRSGASPRADTATAAAEPIPRGMPGSRRAYPSTNWITNRSLESEDDDDEFHLPGIGKTRKPSETKDGLSGFQHAANDVTGTPEEVVRPKSTGNSAFSESPESHRESVAAAADAQAPSSADAAPKPSESASGDTSKRSSEK